MILSDEQNASAPKVVQVYISKLDTEMIDKFRQL